VCAKLCTTDDENVRIVSQSANSPKFGSDFTGAVPMNNDILKSQLLEIRRALELLCEPGEVYELRMLGTGKGTISGYFDNLDKLALDAARFCDDCHPEGIYLTINPVNRALLSRSANHCISYVRHTTSDRDVLRRRWFPLDFDPVRPAGISSTDEEHEAALARARKAQELLASMQFPSPVLADSGNGAHLLYRIDEENDDLARERLKRCLDALALKFDDDKVKVDKTTFNAARIWKLYGTIARKGDSLPDRPHRLARILART
jgi:hypothetical protein